MQLVVKGQIQNGLPACFKHYKSCQCSASRPTCTASSRPLKQAITKPTWECFTFPSKIPSANQGWILWLFILTIKKFTSHTVLLPEIKVLPALSPLQWAACPLLNWLYIRDAVFTSDTLHYEGSSLYTKYLIGVLRYSEFMYFLFS